MHASPIRSTKCHLPNSRHAWYQDYMIEFAADKAIHADAILSIGA